MREKMFFFADKCVTLRKCNVKLEVGTLATDWTPAPEDSNINSLQGTLESVTSGQGWEDYTLNFNVPNFLTSYLVNGTKMRINMGNNPNPNSSGIRWSGRISVNGGITKEIMWQGARRGKPIWDVNEIIEWEFDGNYWHVADEVTRLLKNVYAEATSGVTEINGGLVLTKMVQCGTGDSQAGIIGVDTDTLAFFAGGNPADANTPVKIWRDGNAKFADLELMSDGKIAFRGGKFQLINSNLPTPSTNNILRNSVASTSPTNLVYSTYGTDSLSISEYDGQWHSQVLALEYGGILHYGMPIHVRTYGFTAAIAAQWGRLHLQIRLKSGNTTRVINSCVINHHWDSKDGSTTVKEYHIVDREENEVVTYTPDISGTSIELIFMYKWDLNAAGQSPSMSPSECSVNLGVNINYGVEWAFYHDSATEKTIIADNGFMVLYDNSNFFRVVENNGVEVTAKGKFNLPGVLWAGRITSDRRITPYFKNTAVYATEISVSAPASNTFTITHRVPNGQCSFAIVPEASAQRTFYITRNDSNGTITIYFNGTITAFDLTIYGSN